MRAIDVRELDRVTREILRPRAGEMQEFAISEMERCLGEQDLRRMIGTANFIPPPSESAHLVDIGGSVFWVPLYYLLGYKNITVISRGRAGGYGLYDISSDANALVVDVLDVDAELEAYPFADASVDRVVCFELLEHFAGDPMHFVAEASRILVDGGSLYLTTPNVLFFGNLVNLALGQHPFGWSVFTNYYADRHNREYTPNEVRDLLLAGGFEVRHLQTMSFGNHSWKRRLFGELLGAPGRLAGRTPKSMRGAKVMCVGTKAGPIVDRYPDFLYEMYGDSQVRVSVGPRP